MSQSRQLAAIMFTDIVGYTALMGRDELKAFKILEQFKSVATPLVKKHHGKWHKDLGDGALCSFVSAHEAVKCAIEILQQLNQTKEVKVRIGIHLGDVTFQNGDVFGDGVNIASRIQSEAAPGGICLSEPVHRNVRNKQGIKTVFLGKQKLKNVEGLTALYQVSIPGIDTRVQTSRGNISLWKAVVLSLALAALFSFVSVWYFQTREFPKSNNVERYDILLPDATPLALIGSAQFGSGQTALAISPDGNLLVYAGHTDQTTKLFVRYMEGYEVTVLEGTDEAFFPFFSPSGEWIGFFSNNHLKKVAVKGGAPITLCEAINPNGAVWAPDDRIIFSDHEGSTLSWIQSEGGERQEFQIEGSIGGVGSFNYPSMLGDNHLVISTDYPGGINVISIDNQQQLRLLERGRNPRYLSSGHISFIDHGRLMAVPFDLENLRINGEIVPIVGDLRTEGRTGQLAISNQGTLIYVPGISTMESKLVFRTQEGIEEELPIKSGYYGEFHLSPNGEKLEIHNYETGDIQIYDFSNQTMTRLTHDGNSNFGIWTPDGTELTYSKFRDKSLHQINASGSGREVELISSDMPMNPIDWSSDGKVLMYGAPNPGSSVDIRFHFLNQGKDDITLMPNRANEYLASFSPKNDFVAYTSDESGQSEVYVQPFPPDGTKWTVSSDGGEEPLWSPDGNKMVYRNGNDWLEVEVSTKPTFSIGTRKLLFNGPYINVSGYSYDISPDGKQFLLLKPVSSARTSTRLKVVKNWFEEVKRLVPPR